MEILEIISIKLYKIQRFSIKNWNLLTAPAFATSRSLRLKKSKQKVITFRNLIKEREDKSNLKHRHNMTSLPKVSIN